MKKRIRDAIRVQVIPDTWGRVNLTEDLEIEIAKQIAASIKRHVDTILNQPKCAGQLSTFALSAVPNGRKTQKALAAVLGP